MPNPSAGGRPTIAALSLVAIVVSTPRAVLALPSEPAKPFGAEAPASMLSGLAPARTMTLDQALGYARAHQPSLRSALARVASAAADTRGPRAQWLPGFGITAQVVEGTSNNTTASYVGVPDLDIPRIGGTSASAGRSWSPQTSTLGAIGAGQEVFDFGRIAAQAAVADTAYVTERHRSDSERLRVDLLVKDAYYAVNGAKAVLTAAQDAVQRARVHRDMAAAGVRSGLHAPIELTRADADLTRFDVGRIRAEGSLRSAQATFAAAVGVADRMLDTAGEPNRDVVVPPLDASLEEALRRDPTLQAARSRVDEAEARARAISAELRPDLSLTATFSGRAGTASLGPNQTEQGPWPTVPNWDVGVVFRWPLYDAVIAARRSAAASRVDVAKADVETLTQQETAAVQQTHVALQVAQVALTGLARAVEAARANYAQAEARFKAGLGTSLELADAEAVRTDAEIQLAVGQFESLRARAALSRLLAEGL
jgi:outer membrane protein TolC